MTKTTIIEAASKLLSKEARYTQGAFARDKTGKIVDALDNNAVCWDVVGAVRKAANVDTETMRKNKIYIAAIAVVNRANKYHAICQCSDRSYKDACNLLKHAYELAKGTQ